MELSWTALSLLALVAFMTGLSKTGFPGLGIIWAVILPMVMPAKVSTGYVLPFLVFGDMVAITYWRRSVAWRHVWSMLPAMCVGVFAGYLLMDNIDDAVYGKVLGGIVLFLVILDWLRRRFSMPVSTDNRLIAYSMGFLAGIMTMLANAAGSVTTIYLLSMKITKEVFVGTVAWLFFFINLFKLPFSASMGLITLESLKINAMMIPFIILGSILGVIFLRNIRAETFDALMRLLALLGGLRLLLQ